MERQIKFRGKRADNGEWVYGELYTPKLYDSKRGYFGEDVPCIFCDEGGVPVIPSTVGQFTGLTDCNGKEIYEGDILGIPEDVDFLPETVIFKEGCFKAQDDYTSIAMNGIDTKCRTIIGNIHDNPELIPTNKQQRYDKE